MTRIGIVALPIVLLLTVAGSFSLSAESPSQSPDFKEVYDLIREHLADYNEVELNKIAVQALLSALAPKVSLGGPTTTEETPDAALISKFTLFDGPVAYVRIRQVGRGLDQAIRQAWQEASATNKLSGMVLDLRFADGTDYAAAAATADLFISKEQPLLDWGKGMIHSKEKTTAISTPLAILVNQKTAAGAEALAGALRQAGVGLVLGGQTAGQAMIAQEYSLKDGERLRIATTPVQLGDGSSLSGKGMKPDIVVAVSPAEERAYFADAFKDLSKPTVPIALGGPNSVSGTNRVRRPRFNEAELVRERKTGTVSDSELPGADSADSEKPAVRDPVLGRALDFLRGLSVVRGPRS